MKPLAAPTNSRAPLPGLRLLTICGGLSLLGYVALFVLMQSHSVWESATLVQDRWKPLFYPIKQLFPKDWVLALRTSPLGLLNSFLYLAVMAWLFTAFLYPLRRAFKPGMFTQRSSRTALKIILLFAVVILAVCFIMPGMFSTDLFSYVWYGRIKGIYGDNPFLNVPQDYAWYDKAHWLQWVYWKDVPSAYGPVWIWLASGIAIVAQAIDGDIVTHLLGHKLVYCLAHLANIVLLWKVARIVVARYWKMPELPRGVTEKDWRAGIQVAITLAYAWTPLAFVEFGMDGHNDVLMATCVLVALRLHLAGRWRIAVGVLALSGLIKVTGLFFLPAYISLLFWEATRKDGTPLLFRDRVGRVAQACSITALVWVLGYLPFWDSPNVLRALTGGPPAVSFIHSIGSVIRYKLPFSIAALATTLHWEPYGFWRSWEIGDRLAFPTRWGLMLITATVAAFHIWRSRTFASVVIAWGWIMFTYLTVGSVWFWPWYVTWALIPVVLRGPGRLFTATQILSFSAMSIYAFHPRAAAPFSEIPGWTGLIIMVPPLLYLLTSWTRDAIRKKSPARARTIDSRVKPVEVATTTASGSVTSPSHTQPRPAIVRLGHKAFGYVRMDEGSESSGS